MDPFDSPLHTVAFTMWLLTLILNLIDVDFVPPTLELEEEEDPLTAIVFGQQGHVADIQTFLTYRFCTLNTYFDEDVGFWVKLPRRGFPISYLLSMTTVDGSRCSA